jgi:uncharacterized protein (TIGR02145 family)
MKQYGFVTYAGQTYKTVEIGEQTWMAENLNYDASGSKCFNNSYANCTIRGKLYNWAMAMKLSTSCNLSNCYPQIGTKHQGICPNDWHIPGNADWDVLMKFVDPSCSNNSSCANGNKLKTVGGWWYNTGGTDDYGFSALPGGYGRSNGGFGSENSGYWWSASELNTNSAYLVAIFSLDDSFGLGGNSWSKGDDFISVRCVKD